MSTGSRCVSTDRRAQIRSSSRWSSVLAPRRDRSSCQRRGISPPGASRSSSSSCCPATTAAERSVRTPSGTLRRASWPRSARTSSRRASPSAPPHRHSMRNERSMRRRRRRRPDGCWPTSPSFAICAPTSTRTHSQHAGWPDHWRALSTETWKGNPPIPQEDLERLQRKGLVVERDGTRGLTDAARQSRDDAECETDSLSAAALSSVPCERLLYVREGLERLWGDDPRPPEAR